MIVNRSESNSEPSQGAGPDWAILVVGADRCVVDRLQATMQAAGHEEMLIGDAVLESSRTGTWVPVKRVPEGLPR